MPILRIHDISLQFRSDRPLLDGISVQLDSGWSGLVGANGCGKSTLLRILSGSLRPDGGTVQWSRDCRDVHFCVQDLAVPDAFLEDFGARQDKDARRMRDKLCLDGLPLSRWASLSAGERKRWQVGAALCSRCDALLLDEPANHLDADSRDLLIESLREFQGLGLVVSHDRELLDALTEKTCWLQDGKLDLYTCSYTQARLLREDGHARAMEERERAQSKAKALERRLRQARENQAAADRGRSLKNAKRGDSDARTLGAKTVKAWAEDRLGRSVQVLREASHRANEAIPFVRDEHLGGPLFLGYEPPRQQCLLRLRAAGLWAGDKRLLGEFAFEWKRGEKCRLSGPNGTGKSTLLNALLGASALPPERLLVLPQEHSPQEVRILVDKMFSLSSDVRGRVCTIFAALGCPPALLSREASLSPGEARKLHLALGLGSHVWGVVLDEPTNHLDLPGIERLERALRDFPGAILLVSHDDRFARACTDAEFSLDAGRLCEVRQG